MSYHQSLAHKSRPILPASTSPSSKMNAPQISHHTHQESSSSRRAPATIIYSNMRGMPELGSRNQAQKPTTNTLLSMDAKREDSDCYSESTPGRAWKKIEQAHALMRVVGFDTSVQYTSRSGASDSTSLSGSRKRQGDGAFIPYSSSAHQSSIPERTDLFRHENLRIPPGKTRTSHGNASAVPRSGGDGSKHVSAHNASVYHKTTMKAN